MSRPSARRFLGVLACAFAVLFLLAPTSAALNQTVNVVVLAPERPYWIGDLVNLTIRTFNGGLPADGSIAVHLHNFGSNARAILTTRTGAGAYQATFEIFATDIFNDVIAVTAEAWIGGRWDYDVLFLPLEGLEVEVSALPIRTAPREVVDIRVRVRENGVPRDVDALSLTANLLSVGGPSISEKLESSWLSPGTYRATFAIPTRIRQDTAVSFVAEASAAGATGSGEVAVLVDVPTRLVVWHHEASIGPGAAELEILVANETGWPVSDANVSLSYKYFDRASVLVLMSQLSSATDGRGVASFDLSFNGAPHFVGFWGTVSTGSAIQGFSGSLVLPAPPGGFQVTVRRDNWLESFVSGVPGRLTYTVLLGGHPLPSQTVYYYARTNAALVASGVVSSDDSGRFSLDFIIPAGYTTIDFATAVGEAWAYDSDSIAGGQPLAVRMEAFYVGSVTHLSLSIPSGPSPWIALVAFHPFATLDGFPDFPWSLASGAGSFYDVAAAVGDSIELDVVVPRFLPKGQDYLLYVYAFPQVPSVSGADIHLYLGTIRIDNLAPTPSARLSSSAVTPGSALDVDASASFDRDGAVEAYRVDWGDGGSTPWTADPTARHTFDRSGVYFVSVWIRDDNGAVSAISLRVRVDPAGPAVLALFSTVAALGLAASATVALLLRSRKPLLRPSRSGVEHPRRALLRP